jgi:hypothetical protein
MKKIMFNDRYALTDAAIEGIKTNTRRIEGGDQFQLAANSAEEFFYEKDAGYIVMCRQGVEIFRHKCRYKVGEIVAVAQSYNSFYDDTYNPVLFPAGAGWDNKMFVKPELMPNQIRISGIKCERLQDISEVDCLKEGVRYIPEINKFYFEDVSREAGFYFDTPREAFAALIDKVSGRGTWKSNPWVVAYEFDLLK